MWRDILWLWFSFPWWLVMLNIIPWAYCPSVFFRKMPIQAFCILKVRYLSHVSRVKKLFSLSLSLHTHIDCGSMVWKVPYNNWYYNYKLIFIMIFITESHTTDESSDDKIRNKHFVMNEYQNANSMSTSVFCIVLLIHCYILSIYNIVCNIIDA